MLDGSFESYCELIREQYEAGKIDYKFESVDGVNDAWLWNTMQGIVHNFLREHPADDSDRVDVTWWRHQFSGLHADIPNSDLLLWLDPEKLVVVIHAEGAESPASVYAHELRHIKTRGQVRRLCNSLGVEFNTAPTPVASSNPLSEN